MARSKRRVQPKTVLVFAGSTSSDLAAENSSLTATDLEAYMYGEHSLKGKNKFEKYQAFANIDPYVNSSLNELGLTEAKGFAMGIADEAKEGSKSEFKGMLKEANNFARKVDLQQLFCEAGMLMAQDGSVPMVPVMDESGVSDILFLPMAYTTFLPKGMKPVEATILESTKRYILKGGVDTILLNESHSDVQTYQKDEVVLLRNFYHGYFTYDILNRPTLGLYGRSMLEPLDTTIKYRQNIIHSYQLAIMRYGHMKLWFEYKVLSEMLANHSINIEDAKKAINEVKLEISRIKANEDVVTSGFEIEPIETDNSINIIDIKKSLEQDISNALCSTEAGSGKGAGTTFASAYMAENRKIMAMESMRKILRTGFENILQRHLEKVGYKTEAKWIRIKLDPIVEPQIAAADYILLFEKGLLDEQQLFDCLGINARPQDEEYQKKKKKEQMDMQTQIAQQKLTRTGEGNPQKKTLRDNPQKNNTASGKVS